MLMKWSDLEPGDIIQISDEIANHYEERDPHWTKRWCYKNFTVKKIEEETNLIKIWIEDDDNYPFVIDKIGNINWGNGPEPLFKIVKLRDE